MSGGSFNYLCWKSIGEAFETADLDDMQRELHRLGFVEAALATQYLIDQRETLGLVLDSLSDVWKAVEWYRSSDWSFDAAVGAAAAYAATNPQPTAQVRAELQARADRATALLAALDSTGE